MVIIEAVTPKAKRAGRGISPPEVYAYFVEQCWANLHMVLAMSPVGDAFRLVPDLCINKLVLLWLIATFAKTHACFCVCQCRQAQVLECMAPQVYLIHTHLLTSACTCSKPCYGFRLHDDAYLDTQGAAAQVSQFGELLHH